MMTKKSTLNACLVAVVILVGAEWALHIHGHYFIGFNTVFAIAACVLGAIVARGLRGLLGREDCYYDE